MEGAFIISVIFGIEFLLFAIVMTTSFILEHRKYNRLKYEHKTAIKAVDSAKKAVSSLTAKTPTLDISERIMAGNQLIELIDHIIDIEIVNTRKYEIFLNKKNPNLDVDHVLEKVSRATFKALKGDVLENRDGIFSAEWLMLYIQKRTTVLYLSYINNVAPLDAE